MSTICDKYFSMKRKNIDMTTVERIKKLAKERGLTLQQVAEKAGIGINSIYRWNKVTPSSNSLEKVAKVFNVTPDYLRGYTDKDKTEGKIQWKDLGMPYGGHIPDELNDMIDSIAETYLKNHPELIKDKYKGKW